jgi:hypothetical protein
VSSFSNETIVRISALKVLVSFLGASWKHFELLVTSLILILLTKSQKSSKQLLGSLQEATKNFRRKSLQ